MDSGTAFEPLEARTARPFLDRGPARAMWNPECVAPHASVPALGVRGQMASARGQREPYRWRGATKTATPEEDTSERAAGDDEGPGFHPTQRTAQVTAL